MSKAILVLDEMPNSCRGCPFGEVIKHYPVVRCMRKNYIKVEFSDDTLPKECPLKKMPQEKEYREIPHSLDLDGMRKRSRDLYLHRLDVDNSYVMGWNECIEEIER